MGTAQGTHPIISSAWDNKHLGAYHRRHLLQRLDEMFFITVSLGCFSGTIDEFQDLRRTFWPNSQFFHESYTGTRLEVASSIATALSLGSADHCRLQCEKLHQILLYPSAIGSMRNDYRLERTVRGIVQSIGQAAFEGYTSVIQVWTEL